MSQRCASGRITVASEERGEVGRSFLVWATLVAIVGLLLVGVAPVHVAGAGGGGPTIVSGPVEIGHELAPDELMVTVLAPAEGTRLSWPWLAPGELVPEAAIDLSGWEAAGDELVSRRSGARLRVSMTTRALGFSLAPGRDAELQVLASGAEALTLSTDGHLTATVLSGQRIATRTHNWWFRTRTFEPPAELAGSWSQAESYIGALPVEHDISATGLTVGRRAVARAVVAQLPSFLTVMATASLMLLLFIAVGVALCSVLWTRGIDSFCVPVAAGIGTTASLLGALHQFLPGWLAGSLTLMAAAALVGWRARTVRDCMRGAHLRRLLHRCGGVPIAGVAITALLVNLTPAVLTGWWNVGLLHTDVYDYFQLTDALWPASVMEAGFDWGNGLRVVDTSVRTTLVGLPGLFPTTATWALRVCLLLVIAGAVGEAARQLTHRRAAVVATVVIAVGSAAGLGLWVEGYLSRHVFIMLLMLSLSAAIVVASAHPNDAWKPWALVGAALAVPVAIVPPYSTVAPATVIALLAAGWGCRRDVRGSRRWLPPLLGFTGATAALAVPNLLWLRGIEVAARYAEGVEEIGRVTVLPFFDTGRYPAALLGLIPFHANGGSLIGDEVGPWVPDWLKGAVAWLDASAVTWILPCVAGSVLLLLLWLSRAGKRRASLSSAITAWSLALTFFGFFLFLPAWSTQSYFILMWGWTLAPLVLVAAALVIVRATSDADRVVRSLAVSVLAALATINVANSLVEASRWLEHPRGPILAATHFKLVPGLIQLQNRAPALAATAASYAVSPTYGDLRADDGRVALNHMEIILRDVGLRCANCVRDRPRNNSLLGPEPHRGVEADFLLVVGGVTCGDRSPIDAKRGLYALCPPTSEDVSGSGFPSRP